MGPLQRFTSKSSELRLHPGACCKLIAFYVKPRSPNFRNLLMNAQQGLCLLRELRGLQKAPVPPVRMLENRKVWRRHALSSYVRSKRSDGSGSRWIVTRAVLNFLCCSPRPSALSWCLPLFILSSLRCAPVVSVVHRSCASCKS